ncbi:MAG: HlyC/CorC family transporter, partial [Spirochaetales bacterium]|nr:HlyC/CorC family transporter [Spirochaetales bacterium]
GDLDDNYTLPEEPPLIERIDSHTWRVQGSTPLDLLSKKLGVELPEDDYETFGGLVFGLLGTIPEDGSTPELEEYGLIIKVTEIREHRLVSALICLEQPCTTMEIEVVNE